MSHSGAEKEGKAGVEVTKDRNGVDQVVLRNKRGASARVRFSGSLTNRFNYIRKCKACVGQEANSYVVIKLFRLVCTEGRYFLGKMNVVKNYCSLAVR